MTLTDLLTAILTAKRSSSAKQTGVLGVEWPVVIVRKRMHHVEATLDALVRDVLIAFVPVQIKQMDTSYKCKNKKKDRSNILKDGLVICLQGKSYR